MHLSDRSGGERLGLEALECLLDGETEFLLNHLTDHGEFKWSHLVLQLDQFLHDVGGQDVRTRAEQLAELNERRSQFVEHLSDVAAALRGRRRARPAPVPQGREKTVALEEVSEAVTEGDFGDLAYPLEIADTGEKTGMSGRSCPHYAPAPAARGCTFVPALTGRPGVFSRWIRRAVGRQPFEKGDALLDLADAQLQVLHVAPRGDAKVAKSALEERSRPS